MKKDLIVICVPLFNEADNILNVLDDIDSYIENTAFSKFYDFNVIFYNDGSTDNTSEIIQNNSSHRLVHRRQIKD